MMKKDVDYAIRAEGSRSVLKLSTDLPNRQ